MAKEDNRRMGQGSPQGAKAVAIPCKDRRSKVHKVPRSEHGQVERVVGPKTRYCMERCRMSTEKSKQILIEACKFYCDWYDGKDHQSLSPGEMTYELVTYCREALRELER